MTDNLKAANEAETDSALAITAARWLATHRILLALNSLMFFCAQITTSNGVNLIPFGLFAYAVYLHIRLEFDAGIFADFAARRLSPQDFDAQLRALFNRAASGERSMAERAQGAIGLYKRLLIISFLLALATLGVFRITFGGW